MEPFVSSGSAKMNLINEAALGESAGPEIKFKGIYEADLLR